MPDVHLSIQVEESFASLISEDWLRQAVELTLLAVGIGSSVELGIVIAGDDTVHELNQTYRGVDATTDVLAFALSEHSNAEVERFVVPPDDILHLGEIVISYPRAKEQAEERRHSVERELALLATHGVLHLLGYDHEQREAEQKMRALETRVLKTIQNRA